MATKVPSTAIDLYTNRTARGLAGLVFGSAAVEADRAQYLFVGDISRGVEASWAQLLGKVVGLPLLKGARD